MTKFFRQTISAIGTSLILLTTGIISAQTTETYETETALGTTFSEGGLTFALSGDLFIENNSTYGCCPSNRFLSTIANNGLSSGNVGQVLLTTFGKGFQLQEFDAWTSNDDGANFASGNVTFIGIRPNGSTVSQTIEINPTSNSGTGFEHINLSATTLNGVTLIGLEMVLTGTLGYIAIDNFKFLSVNIPSITINDPSTTEGDAGTKTLTLTATLTNAASGAFTVNFATANNTATTGNNDYASTSGTLNFAGTNGETQPINVTLNGDTQLEPDEIFLVNLTNASLANVRIFDAQGTGTIQNDDGGATLSIAAANAIKLEGNTGTTPFFFNVTRGGDVSGTTTVQYAVTGSGGNPANTADFGGAFPSGTLTFNPAETALSLPINVSGDVTDENNETFTVTLSNPSAGAGIITGTATGTILDDDMAVETFETEVAGTSFSEQGANFTTTGALAVATSTGIGCCPSNFFLLATGSSGNVGSIQFGNSGIGGFIMQGLDVWISSNGGNNFATGNVTFTGTLAAGGTVAHTFNIVPTGDTGTDFDNISFAGTPLENQILRSLAINISTPLNYIQLDNFKFGLGNQGLVSISDVSLSESNSGTTNLMFAVTHTGTSSPFTLNYATANNSAASGSDYTNTSGMLSFNGTNNQTLNVSVPIMGDMTVELNENFFVNLSSISNPAVTLQDGQGLGTITNNDAATVSIVGDVLQSEILTPMNFSLQLSNPVDANVTVQFSTTAGTATAGSDYTTITNQTVTFNANTTTTQVVGVAIASDNIVEESETLTASIATLNASGRNVSIGASSRTGTINNDDSSVLTLSGGASVTEGNSGNTNTNVTIVLSNPVQGGLTVAFSLNDGTANTTSNDYVDFDATVVINGAQGETVTVPVSIVGDLNIENNETFTVALSGILGPPAGTVTIAGSPQTITIFNDEKDWGDAPTATQSGFANNYPTSAANSGANHALAPGSLHLGATVDADLNGQPNANATGDGTDEDGVTLPSAFTPNTNANITVNASGSGNLNAWVDWNRNGIWEGSEQVFTNQAVVTGNNALSISVPAGASSGNTFARFRLTTATGTLATGTAADGEVEDYEVSIVSNSYSISSPTVTEGNAPNTAVLNFVISRLDNTSMGSVNYSAPGGTATAGTDYVTIPGGTINFAANGNMSETVSITVNGDAIVEDNETVVITLSNPVGGGIGTGTGTGTITNDDIATLTLTGGTIQNEGNIGTVGFTFTATLNKAVQDGFKVAYTTTGVTATAGVDFTDNDGMLTFAGNIGEPQSWTVDVNGDNTVELGEIFEGALGAITMTSAVQAAAISVNGSPKTDVITNDDAAIVSIAANVSQSEATTPQAFTVTLSNPVDVNVTVQFSTANNTATTGDNDYTGIVNQQVAFNAGTTTAQTVNVSVNNDNKVEASEVFDVSIGTLEADGRNVTLGTSARTGTILNNDNATVTLTGGIAQNEGNSGGTNFVFTAELDNPVQGGFTLAYTTNDDIATTADSDYADNDGTLTFADNSTTPQNITVQVNGDHKVEADETFTVALGTFGGTSLIASLSTSSSPKTGTIENDEVDWGDAPDPLYPTLSASTGASHKTQLGVHLGAAIDGEDNGQPTANADGDGADDDGVTLPSTLITNTSANITVNASTGGLLNAWVDWNQNGIWESPSEQIFTNTALVAGNNALTFAVPAGATLGTSFARFRFGNGNLAPTGSDNTGEVEDYKVNIANVQFSIDDPMVTEGDMPGTSNLTFTISRNNAANDCAVNYAISGGTATSGADYQAFTSGTVNFLTNGPLFQTITVVVNRDNTVELNETVEMSLSAAVGAGIADNLGIGTITNDDQSAITIDNPSLTEGDAGTAPLYFHFTLSKPLDTDISMDFTAVNGTATLANNDFVGTFGSIDLLAGETTGFFSIEVRGDCAVEPNETFSGRLLNLSANGRDIVFNGGQGTLNGTGTINNDDANPTVTCPTNKNLSAVNPPTCTVVATGIDAAQGDNCATTVLSYARSGASSGGGTGQASGQTFNQGVTTVTYTVSDGANPNSSCAFTVTVACQVTFGGRVIWKQDNTSGVKDVTVTLSGDQTASVVTPLNGTYSITVPPGGNFMLTPSKNLNKLNGVNASDATRIQQHLSGGPITNPYQLVAADVNSNNTISALDANIIQLALLGNPSALAQMVNSWRFVPTTHTMANPPWGFPEKYTFTGISGDQTNKDFYGIKVGDVVATFANPANAGQPLVLSARDQFLTAGETLTVALEAGAVSDLAALQFALRFDPEQLQLTGIRPETALPLTDDNFGLHETAEGLVRFVWAGNNGIALRETAPMFHLTFKVLESGGLLSAALDLDHAVLPGHAYTQQLAESDVSLRYSAVTGTQNPALAQARVRLLQNRPNPFTAQTSIGFVLPEACEAQLRILDAGGRLLAVRNKQYPAGRHDENFDLPGLSGVLYYELTTPFGVLTKKMVMVGE